jgi:hypothetical protein
MFYWRVPMCQLEYPLGQEPIDPCKTCRDLHDRIMTPAVTDDDTFERLLDLSELHYALKHEADSMFPGLTSPERIQELKLKLGM